MKKANSSLSKKPLIVTGFFCMLIIVIISSSCHKQPQGLVINGPMPQPNLPAIPYSYTNTTNTVNNSGGFNNLATLGRVLFYDVNLSLNNAISCGSCHKQEFAFGDNHQFSSGLNNVPGTRNAVAIVADGGCYSSQHTKFWDGRAATVDTAVFMPVVNPHEMDIFNLNLLPNKLSRIQYYPALFNSAYGSPAITVQTIRLALAAFVGTLVSTTSRFDQCGLMPNCSNNGSDTIPLNTSITPLELQGWKLFIGKGRCYNCHNGSNLNGEQTDYENTGLDVNYTDKGRGNITHLAGDNGKFKVPTLRNIALSAPYMHDGRYTTLSQVIEHYNSGVQYSPNLSLILTNYKETSSATHDTIINGQVFQINVNFTPGTAPVQLNLTTYEKKALEAFLNSLTDVNFVTDPRYANPF